jgi:hypothetical protein
MAVMRISSSPVFSRVRAGVPLLHERGGITNGGLLGPGVQEHGPGGVPADEVAATAYEHHVLGQVRVQGRCIPHPDNCLEHSYVLVFEHDFVVIGGGDGPVQVIDRCHGSLCRMVAHTPPGLVGSSRNTTVRVAIKAWAYQGFTQLEVLDRAKY